MEFERQHAAPKADLRRDLVTKYVTGKERVRRQEK
jgi:hypothetical protein